MFTLSFMMSMLDVVNDAFLHCFFPLSQDLDHSWNEKGVSDEGGDL